MFEFLSTTSKLHTRGINYTIQEYLFCLNVVLGENECTSYALAFDPKGLKKVLGTEDEQTFVQSVKDECDKLLKQQHIVKLRQELEEQYTMDIQGKALNLENYKFTGGQIAQILQNLLHNRVADLDNASTKDVIGLIKLLTEQFGIEGGSDFEKHFIQIYPPFNALCVNCSREFDCHPGIGAVCPHCGQNYNWSIDEERFYPQPMKL